MAMQRGKDYDITPDGDLLYDSGGSGKPRTMTPEQGAYVLAVLYKKNRSNWARILMGYELDQPGGPGSKF